MNDMSLRPRPGETPEDVIERVTKAAKAANEIKPWPRGRCEYWTSDRTMCGKKGRWMVNGQIRCGEHKEK